MIDEDECFGMRKHATTQAPAPLHPSDVAEIGAKSNPNRILADHSVNLRHGVSRLRSGHRHTVGVIFHDAK
jgi:uncharacterized protein